MSQQASAGQIRQNNFNARSALLATSPRFSKDLGSFVGGIVGGSTRIKLYNVGIITRLLLKVTVKLDIGTAVATPSANAPFNLIKRLRLTDFDGTDRINCTGEELFLVNCVRRGTYTTYNNEGATAILSNPVVPTAVANNQELSFFIEVPVAFDPEADLRGAILAQTSVGELSLNIDWTNSLYANGSDDSVYNGAATSTVAVNAGSSISVQVYQDYLLPQNLGAGIILPELDLLTVYEISGALRSSDNLAQNAEKLINIPNVRSVIGAYQKLVNNGLQNASTTDLSKIRVIANGSNVLYERNADAQLLEQRMLLNSDTRKGFTFIPFRRKPLETSLYGNVQIGMTPASAISGNAYVGICFESFYTKGSTLPGLSQASG